MTRKQKSLEDRVRTLWWEWSPDGSIHAKIFLRRHLPPDLRRQWSASDQAIGKQGGLDHRNRLWKRLDLKFARLADQERARG